MLDKLKLYGPWAIALLALFSALWSWYYKDRILVPGPGWIDVTNHSSNEPRVVCQDNKIVVVKAGKMPEKGNLSENAQTASQDTQEVILATGDVPASKTGFELKSTLSPSTGEAKIIASPKSRSLFGFEDEKEVGLRYNGMRTGIFGRWTFVRAGSFYGAVYAEANTKPDSQIMVELSYRW